MLKILKDVAVSAALATAITLLAAATYHMSDFVQGLYAILVASTLLAGLAALLDDSSLGDGRFGVFEPSATGLWLSAGLLWLLLLVFFVSYFFIKEERH